MTATPRFLLRFVPLLVLVHAACGGQTTDGGTGSSTPGTTSSSTSDMCINFELEPGDLACTSDTDCTSVNTGEICDGSCAVSNAGCGLTPANEAAAARWTMATAPLSRSDSGCPCLNPGGICGAGGMCVAAPRMPYRPANDAGTCGAPVPASATSCTTASDCVVVPNGTCCDDVCYCYSSAVNASAGFSGAEDACQPACSCPPSGAAACVSGQCTIASFVLQGDAG